LTEFAKSFPAAVSEETLVVLSRKPIAVEGDKIAALTYWFTSRVEAHIVDCSSVAWELV
jgi:hypothetical protein